MYVQKYTITLVYLKGLYLDFACFGNNVNSLQCFLLVTYLTDHMCLGGTCSDKTDSAPESSAFQPQDASRSMLAELPTKKNEDFEKSTAIKSIDTAADSTAYKNDSAPESSAFQPQDTLQSMMPCRNEAEEDASKPKCSKTTSKGLEKSTAVKTNVAATLTAPHNTPATVEADIAKSCRDSTSVEPSVLSQPTLHRMQDTIYVDVEKLPSVPSKGLLSTLHVVVQQNADVTPAEKSSDLVLLLCNQEQQPKKVIFVQ